eukprot:TRINITY_DN6952_c0_g1_i1.p1 TRINITY_DN6952_c0_g1~~TRINITY_DN6952_c0_g1_i1.p1  ORF type:complete len:206 (-),score=21.14 TRINITY_DN6952_c0_g1_i1:37-654(-)
MIIKPMHKHVDSKGTCYHPYLAQWNPNNTLQLLLGALQSIFSQDPPVRAKAQTSPHPVHQQQPVMMNDPQSMKMALMLKIQEGIIGMHPDPELLKQEKRRLAHEAQDLDRKIVEVNGWLQSKGAGGNGGSDVDAMTQPSDSYSQQLLNLVAEDAAIDDAIYHVERNVYNGNINAQDFIRSIRQLSKRQFLARATIEKVKQQQRRK